MRKQFQLKENSAQLKERLIEHCSHEEHSIFLDSNGHRDQYSRFDYLAAFGALELLSPKENSLAALKAALRDHADWYFGHLSFDLKNQLEDLQSKHKDPLDFAPLEFFRPRTLVICEEGKLRVESCDYASADEFMAALPEAPPEKIQPAYSLQPQISREEYLAKIAALKAELQFGNIYEINFCLELAAHHLNLPVAATFRRLNNSARAPFAGYYRSGSSHLLCASPERYLQKTGERIISQPIKGTAPRSANPQEDEQLRQALLSSEKERSENVMITDLVRNDLSRVAQPASVRVDELFGIYSFNTVHQMITTVSARLAPPHQLADVLATSFPMGSMTGAPKLKALELIEEHENFSRSLYSGALGYITPEGDCDFNVVIRSLFYQQSSGYLSARVGSAITIHCDAELEYQECLLKAENLLRVLQAD